MSKRITQAEFERRIKQRFPEESFTVLQYDSLGKPASIQCDTCQKIIEVSKATNFLIYSKAHGCVNCHGLWKQREEKLKLIKERYEILDTSVKNTHTYYHVKCKNCGHERNTDLKNLTEHLECGCTTGTFRGRTAEEFLQAVNDNSRDGSQYELVSEYKDQLTKVLLRHKPCGFIWDVRPADVIKGRSFCPKCGRSQSAGEHLVSELLRENAIPFEPEKRLDNSLQRFDFYIEVGDKKIAIEYNGRQHYEEVPFFAATLSEYQERDNRKRQYCRDKGIELIEIPYTDSASVIENKIKQLANRLNDYPKGVEPSGSK